MTKIPEDLVGPFRRRPDRSGVFLDFDGTLSEIVPLPSQARPLEGAPEVLTRLAHRFAVLAIVSGRSAADLVGWLGSEIEIWGLHGAERAVDGSIHLADEVAPFQEVMGEVREFCRRAVEDLGLDGVIVEDKRVIVTLHYRNAVEPERAKDALEELARGIAEEKGLRWGPGRASFELRPPVDVSKAQVVRRRARSLEAVLFAGDDVVDLAAFDALDELTAEGIHAVRVGVASAEAPAELLERADLIVDGPDGALDFLKTLL